MDGPDLPRRFLPENSMEDVTGFLGRWACAKPSPVPYRLRTSSYGNINSTGDPGDYNAPDLTPYDPQWKEAIEPGVWPLVDVLVNHLGFVTYTSCEGHLYGDLDIPFVPRQVGVLPHTAKERHWIARQLRHVTAIALADLDWPTAVRPAAWSNVLQCRSTGAEYHTIDLVLEMAHDSSPEAYFAEIGAATAVSVRMLNQIEPLRRSAHGRSSEAGRAGG